MASISRLGLLGGLLAAAVFAASAESHGSRLVRSATRSEATHLRLILSSAPPSILDVDTGALVRVPNVTHGPRPVLWVAGVPGGAVAIIGSRSEQGFLIRPNGSARRLASGASLLASWNSAAVWALDHRRGGGCALRLVPGMRPATRAPCGNLDSDGKAGVVIGTARGELLVDPETGHVRAHVQGDGSALVPLHGNLVFEETTTPRDGQTKLSLLDVATGQRRVLRWPSQLDGLDGVEVEPHGTLVAIGFASPSSNPQSEDLVLLDTRTGKFTRVPGYPISEDLKFSSVAWTSDDRLVLTIHLGSSTHLGIYRPGDRRVSLRPLHVPAYAGSDTFVPIVSR